MGRGSRSHNPFKYLIFMMILAVPKIVAEKDLSHVFRAGGF
jgi:hypothetical protein